MKIIIILISGDSFKIIVYNFLFLKRFNFIFYHCHKFIFYLKFTSQFRIGNAMEKLFFKLRILFPKRENERTNEHDNANNYVLCDFL